MDDTANVLQKLDNEEREEEEAEDAVYLEELGSWVFSQWFRTQESDENGSDILSAMDFSEDGTFLATGDVGGRIVVLKGAETDSGFEYQFHCEFNSHEPEFDYVRSQPINERINRVQFLPSANDSQFLLATNDREIKMWKLYENGVEDVNGWNLGRAPRPFRDVNPEVVPDSLKESVQQLKLPTIEMQADDEPPYVDARLRHTFSRTVHEYSIHSVSLMNDGETFLSADNLRINQWNLNVQDASFNIVDLRPLDIKQLNEWINATDAHPEHSNLFIYGTNRAHVKLCDTREKAHCEQAVRVFGHDTNSLNSNGETKGFFDELTRSIADVKFSASGRFFITRDFMSVKFWDTAMEKAPLETIWIHEYLRPSEAMWHMYENELLHDRFHLGVSPTGDVVTGSYNNYFHIYNVGDKTDTFTQASKAEPIGIFPLKTGPEPSHDAQAVTLRKKNRYIPRLFGGGKRKAKAKTESSLTFDPYGSFDYNAIDFSQKVLGCAWHPSRPTVAIAGANNLYIYKQETPPPRKHSL